MATLLVPYARARYEASFGRPFPTTATRIGASRDVRLLAIAVFGVAMLPFAGLVAVAALASVEAIRRLLAGWNAGRHAAAAAES